MTLQVGTNLAARNHQVAFGKEPQKRSTGLETAGSAIAGGAAGAAISPFAFRNAPLAELNSVTVDILEANQDRIVKALDKAPAEAIAEAIAEANAEKTAVNIFKGLITTTENEGGNATKTVNHEALGKVEGILKEIKVPRWGTLTAIGAATGAGLYGAYRLMAGGNNEQA